MLFGDNLSDFSAAFDKQPTDTRNAQTRNNAALFGTRFIVLPNAMYGDWEGDVVSIPASAFSCNPKTV